MKYEIAYCSVVSEKRKKSMDTSGKGFDRVVVMRLLFTTVVVQVLPKHLGLETKI